MVDYDKELNRLTIIKKDQENFIHLLNKYKNRKIDNLECHKCNIHYVPLIKGLKKLAVYDSKKLENIIIDPKTIREITLINSNIKEIENFSECQLESLMINKSNIKEIIIPGNVRKLSCSFNNYLEYIDAKNVIELECNYCPTLKIIKNIENIEVFNNNNCPSLKYVPIIPKLRWLNSTDSVMAIFCEFRDFKKNAERYHEWLIPRLNLLKIISLRRNKNIPENIYKTIFSFQ